MVKLESLWPERIWNKDLQNTPKVVQDNLLSVYKSLNKVSPTSKEPLSDKEWDEAYTLGINLLQAIFRKSKKDVSEAAIKDKLLIRLGVQRESVVKKEIGLLTAPYWAVFGFEPEVGNKVNKVKGKRVGPDYTDISAETLRSHFNFKSIINNGTPQQLIEIYTAFADLSDIVNLPKKWIGSGAVTLVIGEGEIDENQFIQYQNNNKSVSHQWMLCLDMRIAAAIKQKMHTVDRYASTMYQESVIGDINPILAETYKSLHKLANILNPYSEKPAQFSSDMSKYEIEKGIKPGTLTSVQDLVALSFNYYVEHKLKLGNRQNDYLCKSGIDSYIDMPTPNNSDFNMILELFDIILSTMKPQKN